MNGGLSIKEIIGLRDDSLVADLTTVWNQSVRTSHHFLQEEDIEKIEPYVGTALREIEHLIVPYSNRKPVGFMGIQNDKIEMLFLLPEYIGKGLGSKLIDLAIDSYGAKKVDVNEQNTQAAGFYEHKGFRVYQRDESDEQGNPFPILHMEIPNASQA